MQTFEKLQSETLVLFLYHLYIYKQSILQEFTEVLIASSRYSISDNSSSNIQKEGFCTVGNSSVLQL